MEQSVNCITIRGSLQQLPQFSHDNHGHRFYKFYLEVPRLSGAVDILPVISRQELMDTLDPTAGSMFAFPHIYSTTRATDAFVIVVVVFVVIVATRA